MKVIGSRVSCPVCGVVVMQDKQGVQECSHLLAVFTTFDGQWLFDVGGIQKAVEKKAEEYEKEEGVINESVTNAFKNLYDGRDDMVLLTHNGGYIGGGIEVEETYLFARKAGTVAAMKAWETMRKAETKMSPKQRNELGLKRSQEAQRAAKKAWKTMKDREAKMSPKQLKALHQKRSDAAKKAWDTIRSAKK